MTNPYRDIFRAPGALAFSAAGFVARLPWAMVTLGIVTMLSQARGEVKPIIHATFPLERASDAHRALDQGHVGKIVLTV